MFRMAAGKSLTSPTRTGRAGSPTPSLHLEKLLLPYSTYRDVCSGAAPKNKNTEAAQRLLGIGRVDAEARSHSGQPRGGENEWS